MGDTAQERVSESPQEGHLWELGSGELSKQNWVLLPLVPILGPLGIGPVGMVVSQIPARSEQGLSPKPGSLPAPGLCPPCFLLPYT